MKLSPSIVVAMAIAIAIVIMAIGFVLYVMKPGGSNLELPKTFIDAAKDTVGNFLQNKVSITIQNDVMDCKPIAEIALRKVRVRSIFCLKTTKYKSTKVLIGHRSFDIRIGWDMKADLRIAVDEKAKHITVSVPEPKILSVSGVEPAPVILFSENGLVNKVTPEDMAQMMAALEKEAIESQDYAEAMLQAKEDLKKYAAAMFSSTGFSTEVVFRPSNQ